MFEFIKIVLRIFQIKMKVKEVDRTANIAWSPAPQVKKDNKRVSQTFYLFCQMFYPHFFYLKYDFGQYFVVFNFKFTNSIIYFLIIR